MSCDEEQTMGRNPSTILTGTTILATRTSIVLIGVALLLGTGTAMAAGFKGDPGDRVEHRFERIGDHRERQLDRRGDRIDHRLDRRAARARAHGHAHLADRLDRKGDRIDARLDRKGERAEAHWDRRGDRFDQRWDRRH
jgi:hypothetical protein